MIKTAHKQCYYSGINTLYKCIKDISIVKLYNKLDKVFFVVFFLREKYKHDHLCIFSSSLFLKLTQYWVLLKNYYYHIEENIFFT